MSDAGGQEQQEHPLVQPARQDGNAFKMHVSQLVQSETPLDPSMALHLERRAQNAETLIQQAEKTFKCTKKLGVVASRRVDFKPSSDCARRTLSILLPCLESNGLLMDLQEDTGEASEVTQEILQEND